MKIHYFSALMFILLLNIQPLLAQGNPNQSQDEANVLRQQIDSLRQQLQGIQAQLFQTLLNDPDKKANLEGQMMDKMQQLKSYETQYTKITGQRYCDPLTDPTCNSTFTPSIQPQ